jgi:hypothetical protein
MAKKPKDINNRNKQCMVIYSSKTRRLTIIMSTFKDTLLDGSNVRLNWNIESDMNVNWIKFKNFLSLYWFKNTQH